MTISLMKTHSGSRIVRLWAVIAGIFLLFTMPLPADGPDGSDGLEETESSSMEFSFLASPKLGGGSLTQGSLRYYWTPTVSSRVGFSYSTDTFNVEYAADDIVDSLGLVTNDDYRLDLVPYERVRGRNRWALGINTTIEETNEYGFYRTETTMLDDGYIVSFEEDRFRVFISPRVGWRYQFEGGWVTFRNQLWVSPLFLASLDETFRYEFDSEGENEEVIDGIGVGFPEIEVETSLEFSRLLRLDLGMVYRYFVMEELRFDFDEQGDVFFDAVETEYDLLRFQASAGIPITLPNESRFRVGAGFLLYLERNLTTGTERREPGFTVVFGVD